MGGWVDDVGGYGIWAVDYWDCRCGDRGEGSSEGVGGGNNGGVTGRFSAMVVGIGIELDWGGGVKTIWLKEVGNE